MDNLYFPFIIMAIAAVANPATKCFLAILVAIVPQKRAEMVIKLVETMSSSQVNPLLKYFGGNKRINSESNKPTV